MKRLKLNEMLFGKTDAYSEYNDYGHEVFRDLFYPYPNFNLEKILNGSNKLVCENSLTYVQSFEKNLEKACN